MTKPIVARLPDGREYGFADAKTALRLHPDAEIVRYQDGSEIEPEKPKRKAADKPESKDAA